MMKLKTIIDSPCGFRYCFESLPLQSGYARKCLLDSEMMTTCEEISSAYADIRRFIPFIGTSAVSHLQFRLKGIKDVSGTVARLERSGTLDDIELFEVKNLSMLALEIADILTRNGIGCDSSIDLEGIRDVVSILDPDRLGIASFYVYDSYSEELAQLRNKIKSTSDSHEREKLISDSLMMEADVRKNLSNRLKPYSRVISDALTALANIDISLAKAIMMRDMGLVFPKISENGETSYKGLRHPQVSSILEGRGLTFQKVSISIGKGPVLVIGANMGGKTVVLKTLTLCQHLCQFGFGIPAESAKIALKDDIFLVTGDGQNEKEGLSSFAAEMKSIDTIIKNAQSESKTRILALIDEPARSTNPIEGTALVSSLMKILDRDNVALIVTTHYNVESEGCRLKVRGMGNGKMNYELCDSPSGEVPHEALSVAESLHISPSWLEEAKKLLKCKAN